MGAAIAGTSTLRRDIMRRFAPGAGLEVFVRGDLNDDSWFERDAFWESIAYEQRRREAGPAGHRRPSNDEPVWLTNHRQEVERAKARGELASHACRTLAGAGVRFLAFEHRERFARDAPEAPFAEQIEQVTNVLDAHGIRVLACMDGSIEARTQWGGLECPAGAKVTFLGNYGRGFDADGTRRDDERDPAELARVFTAVQRHARGRVDLEPTPDQAQRMMDESVGNVGAVIRWARFAIGMAHGQTLDWSHVMDTRPDEDFREAYERAAAQTERSLGPLLRTQDKRARRMDKEPDRRTFEELMRGLGKEGR